MPRATTGTLPRFNLGCEPQRWSETRRPCSLELLPEQRREHDHRPRDAELAQLFAFYDGCDAISPWIEDIERSNCGGGAKPVRVRLHHRQQPNPGVPRHGRSITLQRAKIDLDL